MNRSQRMESQLRQAFRPPVLELSNESHQHSVPSGSETHFKLLIVADVFEGLSRVDRQREIHAALETEFKSGLHALTIRALSPKEWQEKGMGSFESPACQHKSNS